MQKNLDNKLLMKTNICQIKSNQTKAQFRSFYAITLL